MASFDWAVKEMHSCCQCCCFSFFFSPLFFGLAVCAAEPLLKLLFSCWLDETFVEFDLFCRRKQQNIEKKKNNNIYFFIENVGR